MCWAPCLRVHHEKDRVQSLRQLDNNILYLIQSLKENIQIQYDKYDKCFYGKSYQPSPEKVSENNNLDICEQKKKSCHQGSR